LHHPGLRRAAAFTAPAMAVSVGLALPLAARYLAAPFAAGSRIALAAGVALGLVLLWRRPANLTGLRLGLTLLAVGLVVGWVWR
jgi:hypothetical protein